jgi:flagellar basal-body rod modification protein FlgD
MAISTTSAATAATSSAASAALATQPSIAKNFDTFLRLLTTQLQNQNPLDPLDTNQFTQQLVQFAQVEQQMGMNTSLNTLITLQKASQTTAALGFLGSTVVVDGATAKLSSGSAGWSFATAKPATAVLTLTSANGQTAYTSNITLNAGPQSFTWDGRSNNGVQWPDGNYTLSVVAKDSSGQPVAVSTEVTGVVDGIDLTQNPPVLSVGGQPFTLDKIKQVRPRT